MGADARASWSLAAIAGGTRRRAWPACCEHVGAQERVLGYFCPLGSAPRLHLGAAPQFCRSLRRQQGPTGSPGPERLAGNQSPSGCHLHPAAVPALATGLITEAGSRAEAAAGSEAAGSAGCGEREVETAWGAGAADWSSLEERVLEIAWATAGPEAADADAAAAATVTI